MSYQNVTISKPLKRTIAGLEVYEVEGDPGAPVVLLFHGFGADAKDLISLAQTGMGCKVKPTFLFPNGSLEVPIAPNYVGRGWFPIDIDLLKEAIHEKNSDKIINAFPKDYLAIRETCQNLIAELDIPLSKIFIGGFSQGAILATDLALHATETMAGLIIFSGILVNAVEWKTVANRHGGMYFFQSHGRDDLLLPFSQAQTLEKFLQENGLKGHLQAFNGGHEIPYPILIKFNAFLKELIR